MAIDVAKLESKLKETFTKAGERLQSSKAAIGIADAPEHDLFGFSPRAIKIGNKMIAEAELEELNQQTAFVIEDYERASNIVNQNERNRANINLRREMATHRDRIVKAGLDLDAQITRAKISAKTRNALFKTLGQVISSAGKAYAMSKVGNLKPREPIDKAVGTTRRLSPGPTGASADFDFKRAGETMHGQTYTDWVEQQRQIEFERYGGFELPSDVF